MPTKPLIEAIEELRNVLRISLNDACIRLVVLFRTAKLTSYRGESALPAKWWVGRLSLRYLPPLDWNPQTKLDLLQPPPPRIPQPIEDHDEIELGADVLFEFYGQVVRPLDTYAASNILVDEEQWAQVLKAEVAGTVQGATATASDAQRSDRTGGGGGATTLALGPPVPEQPPPKQKPKPASEDQIHAAITVVNDSAEAAGKPIPNVNMVRKPAQTLLLNEGLYASQDQIRELASDHRHAKRRRQVGRRT